MVKFVNSDILNPLFGLDVGRCSAVTVECSPLLSGIQKTRYNAFPRSAEKYKVLTNCQPIKDVLRYIIPPDRC